MPVKLVFHGGLHLLDKEKRKRVFIELKDESTLKKILEEVDFPINEFWFATTGNKITNLSDKLKGDEVVDLFPPIIGG